MKVFVAGATGAIGRVLVPKLVAGGHEVTGMTRSAERAEGLGRQGAAAVVADALDTKAVHEAVASAAPEAVVHQLTEIPPTPNPRRLSQQLAATNRLRTEGTHNLVEAARAAGVRRIVAQSIAFAYAPRGPLVKDEDEPLWLDAHEQWRPVVEAVAEHERSVTAEDGVVLRYGWFYGPGTAFAHDGAIAKTVRRRLFPVVGDGGGVWSFIHLDDAADATVAALDRGAAGSVFNIVDDEPAPVREWLPAYAAALGAAPPRRAPVLLGRLAGGRHTVYQLTEQRGASNARAKAELDWSPRWASWREGFREALG